MGREVTRSERALGAGDLGPCGYFSFTIHTSKVTGDHLSGPYSVNLDHHWVMGKWVNIQEPFSPQGDRGQGVMAVDTELTSLIGTETAEDPGRRHVRGTVHG